MELKDCLINFVQPASDTYVDDPDFENPRPPKRTKALVPMPPDALRLRKADHMPDAGNTTRGQEK